MALFSWLRFSLLTVGLLCLARRWLARWCSQRYCSYEDIRNAGIAVQYKRKGRVVVAGASISGLLAARVCADHYEEVLLIDAENCTTDPSIKRTRLKQHDQLHIFLGLMYPALCKLFPTFEADLYAAKGTIAPPQPVVYRGGGIVKLPASRQDWSTRQLYVSREVLEALLRRLLLHTCSNVSTLQATVAHIDVQDTRTVHSLGIRRPDGHCETIACALVIDATGTANGSMRWLKKAGFPEPIKQTYDPAIVYTCFTFQLTNAAIDQYDAANPLYPWKETGHIGACFSADHHSVFMRIDNDRVRTMYQTYVRQGGQPEDAAAFLAASKSAQYQDWQKDALQGICGSDDVAYTRSQVNIGVCYRVQYDSGAMPSNLIPLGDTILRVNPIFGQGCTKSVIDCLTLDRVLRTQPSPADSSAALCQFLDLHYARTDAFWRDTRLQDYACEATTPVAGETRETGRWHRALLKYIVQAAHRDEYVGRIMTEVMGALRPCTTYYDPWFLLRCTYARALL